MLNIQYKKVVKIINIDKKDVKKKRMLKIFINTTAEVIKKEGIENSDNPVERLIKMWEYFSFHSFKNLKIYYAIFSENLVLLYY